MKIKFKKLNSRGVAHHLLIPAIAIAVVAGIGAYVIARPKAMTPPSGGSWHVVAQSGSLYVPKKSNKNIMTYTAKKYYTYRVCVTAKAGSGSSVSGYFSPQYDPNNVKYYTYGTSYKKLCTGSFYYGADTTLPINIYADNNALQVQSATWERFY